jgi:hypothetical protein
LAQVGGDAAVVGHRDGLVAVFRVGRVRDLMGEAPVRARHRDVLVAVDVDEARGLDGGRCDGEDAESGKQEADDFAHASM